MVRAKYFEPRDYHLALATKEEHRGIMRRVNLKIGAGVWPRYEVIFLPPIDPATLPWALTHDVKGDEGWAS